MIKIGDLFTIATASGKAYFQFVKKPPSGSLIRVLPGAYDGEPDLDVLMEKKQISGFFSFFGTTSGTIKNRI